MINVNLMKFAECLEAQGMENGAISNGQITASSEWGAYYPAFHGRLHFQEILGYKGGSWVAASSDTNQWLQINLLSLYTKVARVATQGRNSPTTSHWVTNYMLQYGNDGVNFHYYREQGQTANKVNCKQLQVITLLIIVSNFLSN